MGARGDAEVVPIALDYLEGLGSGEVPRLRKEYHSLHDGFLTYLPDHDKSKGLCWETVRVLRAHFLTGGFNTGLDERTTARVDSSNRETMVFILHPARRVGLTTLNVHWRTNVTSDMEKNLPLSLVLALQYELPPRRSMSRFTVTGRRGMSPQQDDWAHGYLYPDSEIRQLTNINQPLFRTIIQKKTANDVVDFIRLFGGPLEIAGGEYLGFVVVQDYSSTFYSVDVSLNVTGVFL